MITSWTAFKYLVAGALFWGIGLLLMGGDLAFYARSEPAQLVVIRMDGKRDHDHSRQGRYGYTSQKWLYRPVFVLDTPKRPRREYAGNTWVRPVPHAVGDNVAGRHDPNSGEMQSNAMLLRALWLSGLLQIIGLFSILQAILMFFGVPESLLLLRLRSDT